MADVMSKKGDSTQSQMPLSVAFFSRNRTANAALIRIAFQQANEKIPNLVPPHLK